MEAITYNLNVEGNADFYSELSVFTTECLEARSEYIINDVNNFIRFNQSVFPRNTKTFDEFYVEYLTIGILLNRYSSNAMSSGLISLAILKGLYHNRNRIVRLKPLIDKLRGILSSLLLKNEFVNFQINTAVKFKHFIHWLEATGEFSEEALHFKYWHIYLKSLTLPEQTAYLKNTIKTAIDFEVQAKIKLGPFTQNVRLFRDNELPSHRFKENYIFCGRHEAEYHLNMVGAEILNRALRNSFMQTKEKVILLPTCMSKPSNGKCKAKQKGSKLTCTGCSPQCNIHLKTLEYSSLKTEVVLIPHSSEFTKYLKYWRDQDTTGLIGIACVLNLLKGGYEMQKLNIPSQCVFLDYCGCKKHWHKDGLATNLNGEQLKKIIDI